VSKDHSWHQSKVWWLGDFVDGRSQGVTGTGIAKSLI